MSRRELFEQTSYLVLLDLWCHSLKYGDVLKRLAIKTQGEIKTLKLKRDRQADSDLFMHTSNIHQVVFYQWALMILLCGEPFCRSPRISSLRFYALADFTNRFHPLSSHIYHITTINTIWISISFLHIITSPSSKTTDKWIQSIC